MGKAIIIKGADFSEVAVDVIQTSKRMLTPVVITGIAINDSGVFSSTSGWAVYYVPIVQDRVYELSIVWRNAHINRVGRTSVVPAAGGSCTILAQQTASTASSTFDYTYAATTDGYMCWQMHITDTVSCRIVEML